MCDYLLTRFFTAEELKMKIFYLILMSALIAISLTSHQSAFAQSLTKRNELQTFEHKLKSCFSNWPNFFQSKEARSEECRIKIRKSIESEILDPNMSKQELLENFEDPEFFEEHEQWFQDFETMTQLQKCIKEAEISGLLSCNKGLYDFKLYFEKTEKNLNEKQAESSDWSAFFAHENTFMLPPMRFCAFPLSPNIRVAL